MNICPICDSTIEGKWCRRCFRFVTPIEIPEKMHLNEGHDLEHEIDCEYHDSVDLSRSQNVKVNEKDWSQKPDSKYKQQIEERRRQMEERRRNADFTPVRIKPNTDFSSVRIKPNTAVPKQQAEPAVKKKKRGIPIEVLIMLAIFIGYVYCMMNYMSKASLSSNTRKSISQGKNGGWENADSRERQRFGAWKMKSSRWTAISWKDRTAGLCMCMTVKNYKGLT